MNVVGGILPVQAFNWESHKKNWYKDIKGQVADWAKQGFTSIWLPPPSDSVSPQVRLHTVLCAGQH